MPVACQSSCSGASGLVALEQALDLLAPCLVEVVRNRELTLKQARSPPAPEIIEVACEAVHRMDHLGIALANECQQTIE